MALWNTTKKNMLIESLISRFQSGEIDEQQIEQGFDDLGVQVQQRIFGGSGEAVHGQTATRGASSVTRPGCVPEVASQVDTGDGACRRDRSASTRHKRQDEHDKAAPLSRYPYCIWRSHAL